MFGLDFDDIPLLSFYSRTILLRNKELSALL